MDNKTLQEIASKYRKTKKIIFDKILTKDFQQIQQYFRENEIEFSFVDYKFSKETKEEITNFFYENLKGAKDVIDKNSYDICEEWYRNGCSDDDDFHYEISSNTSVDECPHTYDINEIIDAEISY